MLAGCYRLTTKLADAPLLHVGHFCLQHYKDYDEHVRMFDSSRHDELE